MKLVTGKVLIPILIERGMNDKINIFINFSFTQSEF
jgi:hypothetical protein